MARSGEDPTATTDALEPEPPGPEPVWMRRLASEALGTFALVVVAVGADAIASFTGGQVSPTARAVAPGLVVMALIYAIADGSGAHFNPVVSLAFALKRLFPVSWLLPYWGAQLVGALAACLLISALLGAHVEAGVSAPHGISPVAATSVELTLTTLLLVVILGTADRARLVGHEAAIAVGATIASCGLIALPLEGASMNPARSLAPALVSGQLGDVAIYVIGPLLAVPLAVGLTRLLHGRTERDREAVEAARGEDPGPRRSGTATAGRSLPATGQTATDRSRSPGARPRPRHRRSAPPTTG